MVSELELLSFLNVYISLDRTSELLLISENAPEKSIETTFSFVPTTDGKGIPIWELACQYYCNVSMGSFLYIFSRI